MKTRRRAEWLSTYLVVACCCVPASAQQGGAKGPPSAEAATDATLTKDERDVRTAAVRFVEAFNAHDAAAVASLFGPNARMEETDGEVVVGREAIQEAYAAEFERSPECAISLEMESLVFLTPDVAVEAGAVDFYPDGQTLTSRSRYIAVHLRRDDAWRIVSSRTLDREVLSNYEHLRDLEWMLGDWIDEGGASVIEFSSKWDDNRSFLLNEFQVIEEGAITLRGTQRIGWDPQAKQIRAWIFDTDGGFGEARWTFVDGEWLVKATGVTAEGASVSATRTYRVVDRDHVIVTTTDRIAGGERLPDFEVTLTRRSPQPLQTATQ